MLRGRFLPAPIAQTALASIAVAALTLSNAAFAQVPAGYPANYADTIAAAKKEGKVVVYATTDTKAADPLIKDFESLYPGVKVEYNDMNSSELYNRFISEQAAGGASADMMWNSSMDSQLKLAQTYALKYDSPEVPHLPKWAVYKGLAYGTTYEPAVFLYNKRLIKDSEVPQTHADLAKLVGSQADRFKNKVTTYDIEKSAVGFMMAAQDNQDSPQYFDFIKAVGPNLVLQSSTGTMMERVASGENLIAYNILGSYALARAKKDPSIGIVYPKDYTLVVSRVAMIAKKAKNPNAAKLWLDYILSKRGQDILANKSDLHSLREDVTGEATAAGLKKILGNTIKPIPVDDSILTFLEPKKRLDFIKQWRTAAGR